MAERVLVRSLLALGLGACSGASSSEIGEPLKRSAAPADADVPIDTTDAGLGDRTCAVEVESNESASRANTFTRCITGKVANWKDDDFLRIVAPATARTMLIEHHETGGEVLYRVSREDGLSMIGQEATFIEDAPEIAVTAGSAYVFRLTFPVGKHRGGGGRPYALAVTFE